MEEQRRGGKWARRGWPLVDRFMAKVQPDPVSGCWWWNGPASETSPGRYIGNERVGGKTRSAHRLSYELHNGPIPGGLYVCHRCDQPMCVNPAHLFLGTAADNMRDRDAKGRQARGERIGASKLDALRVETLRIAAATGVFTQDQLAKWWGISPSGVRAIVSRKAWRHV